MNHVFQIACPAALIPINPKSFRLNHGVMQKMRHLRPASTA